MIFIVICSHLRRAVCVPTQSLLIGSSPLEVNAFIIKEASKKCISLIAAWSGYLVTLDTVVLAGVERIGSIEMLHAVLQMHHSVDSSIQNSCCLCKFEFINGFLVNTLVFKALKYSKHIFLSYEVTGRTSLDLSRL